MPTETVTVQNVGLAIDWGRIILQVGGLCAISGLMGYAAQRVITVRRNLSYVARRLGLGSLRSDANRQFVRGQTDDGRSICLYLEKPHPMLTAISSGLADLVAAALAWDAGVEIAVHGKQAEYIPVDERPRFDQAVSLSLPSLVGSYGVQLAACRFTHVAYDNGVVRASQIKLMASPSDMLTSIEALHALARSAEQAGYAAVRGEAPPTPEVVIATPEAAVDAPTEQAVAPDAATCPTCGARTPSSSPRCQMCGASLSGETPAPAPEPQPEPAAAETEST